MKQKITIHKKNEIVRGTDDYSLMAKRSLNTIYWAMQKHDLYSHQYIAIRFSTMREVMNLQKDNRYIEIIRNSLEELLQPMQLNHFYHPVHKEKFQWFSCGILDEAGFKKKDNEWVVHIKMNSLFKHLMQVEGNFTPLELLPYLHKFRTKYATKIYEYLQSFKGYRYLDISQKHLMQLLALSEDSKYKYYSQLKELLERQLKEIAKKSDLTEVKLMNSKLLTKEKKFRIQINPKSKKDADKLEAQTALDILIKRF
jgi:hypothetical protein